MNFLKHLLFASGGWPAASLVWQLGSWLELIQFDINRIGLVLVG